MQGSLGIADVGIERRQSTQVVGIVYTVSRNFLLAKTYHLSNVQRLSDGRLKLLFHRFNNKRHLCDVISWEDLSVLDI
jgi:hypothetical protein